ncbi:MAG: hypothetical protein ACKODB_00295 [Betaproteobacteria bacterium]|jgi:hypothetical protein
MTTTPHAESVARLRGSLATSPANAVALAALWRSEQALLGALPARYAEVLESLLTRFESGALFGEESCSFSAGDLREQLGLWLDKAERVLG